MEGAEAELRAADGDDLVFPTDMLVEAVTWSGEPRLTRRQVETDPAPTRYVVGWARRDDFGLVAVDAVSGPVPTAWAWTFQRRRVRLRLRGCRRSRGQLGGGVAEARPGPRASSARQGVMDAPEAFAPTFGRSVAPSAASPRCRLVITQR